MAWSDRTVSLRKIKGTVGVRVSLYRAIVIVLSYKDIPDRRTLSHSYAANFSRFATEVTHHTTLHWWHLLLYRKLRLCALKVKKRHFIVLEPFLSFLTVLEGEQ